YSSALGYGDWKGDKLTLGYACQWTKIFKWLGIDLSEEKSIVLNNEEIQMPKNLRSKDNHKTLRCKHNPKNPYHHRLLRQQCENLMDELRSIRLYIEGQFTEIRQGQDRQIKAINRQREAIDLLYTNIGITNPRGWPGP
ncbi:hypothetical protein HN873_024903, partial [Arachis hypogaea]